MSLNDLELYDLIDLAEANLNRMREPAEIDQLMGFTGLQQIVNVITDRIKATRTFAPSPPIDGLAKVIQDAMWDSSGNRMGGPRVAAAAVEEYLGSRQSSVSRPEADA